MYNFDPPPPPAPPTLNPTFMLENMGLEGYTLFFLFLLKNVDCGYPLELPQQGGSNEYVQSVF